MSGFKSRRHIEKEFRIKLDEDVEILIAVYNPKAKPRNAYVMFKKDDGYYEVNALAGEDGTMANQWDVEDADTSELLARMQNNGMTLFLKRYNGLSERQTTGLRRVIQALVN